ncbi:hypothetical protein CMV_018647 [Castanea mollissima]|uniref:Endopeptidase S2P n=1 Tax=Castanea mollissima TaxID=60419 RepID=A0A8J4VCD3_9ROSI|nr:hypothetical protein CMV_018647 [Castanea mollissima]
MEYIAIFIAALFPGALVAFNYEFLQALPQLTALRVYCAGVWHNAVCCVACGLVLFLLPLILFPFYIYGESPMVLDVSSTSPLSRHLSPGDLIMSLDGVHIHNSQEWMEMTSLIDKMALQSTNHSKYAEGFGRVNGMKGYCVPNIMIEDNQKIQSVGNHAACAEDLTAFETIPCHDMRMSNIGGSEDGHPKRREHYCLDAKDIVKLNKCGDGWEIITNGSSCICSLDESCLSPLQMPGLSWVEITFSRSLSAECLQLGRNSFSDSKTSDLIESKCRGSFVFVGDVISMARSVRLTAYQPRWAFHIGRYLPDVLERGLICTFHVSLTLALLNSLPVYFLDGESLLEVTLCHFTSLSTRKREKVLKEFNLLMPIRRAFYTEKGLRIRKGKTSRLALRCLLPSQRRDLKAYWQVIPSKAADEEVALALQKTSNCVMHGRTSQDIPKQQRFDKGLIPQVYNKSMH